MEGPGSSCSPRSDQISLAAEHEEGISSTYIALSGEYHEANQRFSESVRRGRVKWERNELG